MGFEDHSFPLQTTLIYTLYLDNMEYLRNFKKSFDYLKRFGFNFVVVEQRSKNTSDKFFNSPNFIGEYYLIDGIQDVYLRTQAINLALSKVKSKTAFICDADTIIDHNQIKLALEKFESEDLTLVLPYNSSHEVDSESFLNYADLPKNEKQDWLSNYSMDQVLEKFIRPLEFTHFIDKEVFFNRGLIYGVDVEKYLAAGGENPFFLDWGFEDHERYERLRKLNCKIRRLDGPCFHIKHRRRHRESKYKLHNLFEWRKVKEMNIEELSEYIRSWSLFQPIGTL